MRTPTPPKYTWSDTQLTDAVSVSACWRDVLRALGLTTTSESVVRRVRRHVEQLGLDVSHFKGTRTWDDAQLKRAVAHALSWDDVLTSLGLLDPRKDTRARVKGHAVRLGLDVKHMEAAHTSVGAASDWRVDLVRLRDASAAIAAAWFTLRGCVVSLPMEQATYDLLVQSANGVNRVQVKTTTTRASEGGQVSIGRRPYAAGNLAPLMPYDPKVIDYFFIVDGDLTMYLIPSRVIAGRVGLLLRAYKPYVVGNAGGLLGATQACSGAAERSAQVGVGA